MPAYEFVSEILRPYMTDLPTRLRRLYVETGANYVQEAADTIERLAADAAIGQIVRRRLVSGNGIPVSRAYVTAQEVHDIDAARKEAP